MAQQTRQVAHWRLIAAGVLCNVPCQLISRSRYLSDPYICYRGVLTIVHLAREVTTHAERCPLLLPCSACVASRIKKGKEPFFRVSGHTLICPINKTQALLIPPCVACTTFSPFLMGCQSAICQHFNMLRLHHGNCLFQSLLRLL